ncbi:MAG: hypothetical protein AAFX52_00250 [Pseudomonadota bacterium]
MKARRACFDLNTLNLGDQIVKGDLLLEIIDNLHPARKICVGVDRILQPVSPLRGVEELERTVSQSVPHKLYWLDDPPSWVALGACSAGS